MKQLRVHTQTPHLCRKTIHTTQPTNELQEQPEGSTASRAETKRTASRTQLALQSMCRRPNTRSRNGELRVTSSTADAQHVWTLKCEPAGGKTAVGHAVTFPTDAQRATCVHSSRGHTGGRPLTKDSRVIRLLKTCVTTAVRIFLVL